VTDPIDDEDPTDFTLDQFRQGYSQVRNQTLSRARAMWRLGGGTPGVAQHIGSVVTGGQQLVSQLAQLYARKHLGAKFAPFVPGPSILDRPGASKAMVYARPGFEPTPRLGLQRLDTLVQTDLQLAKTRTLYSAFDQDLHVNREPIKIFRRVTGGNPCGLCEIASDQVYFSDDLMPIHDNCECDIEEDDGDRLTEHQLSYHHIGFVESLLGTGDQIKTIAALSDADAPPSAYHNLVSVEQHGELGPVLTWKDQAFKGPSELPDPTQPRTPPPLPGQGARHEQRLRDNMARAEQSRRQAADKRDLTGKPEPRYKAGVNPESKYAREVVDELGLGPVNLDLPMDLRVVNPNISTGEYEWKNNCTRCTTAVELRARGYDVTALSKPKGVEDNSLSSVLSRWESQDGIPAGNTGNGTRVAMSYETLGAGEGRRVFNTLPAGSGALSKARIDDAVKQWGDGSRGFVVVTWKGRRSSHIFNVENRDGKVIYTDGQTANQDASRHFDRVSTSENSIHVVRVDDLKPKGSVKDWVRERTDDEKTAAKNRARMEARRIAKMAEGPGSTQILEGATAKGHRDKNLGDFVRGVNAARDQNFGGTEVQDYEKYSTDHDAQDAYLHGIFWYRRWRDVQVRSGA
jgi:hypothetical protein